MEDSEAQRCSKIDFQPLQEVKIRLTAIPFFQTLLHPHPSPIGRNRSNKADIL
jgi:hypothetical protein